MMKYKNFKNKIKITKIEIILSYKNHHLIKILVLVIQIKQLSISNKILASMMIKGLNLLAIKITINNKIQIKNKIKNGNKMTLLIAKLNKKKKKMMMIIMMMNKNNRRTKMKM